MFSDPRGLLSDWLDACGRGATSSAREALPSSFSTSLSCVEGAVSGAASANCWADVFGCDAEASVVTCPSAEGVWYAACRSGPDVFCVPPELLITTLGGAFFGFFGAAALGDPAGTESSTAVTASPAAAAVSPPGGEEVVDASDAAEALVSAHAIPWPPATAAPIPRATANAPTRPI